MSRKFQIEEPTREGLPMMVGFMGPPGSGKTKSALRLADGFCEGTGKRPVIVDSEQRAGQYKGEHDFGVINLKAPHNPASFKAAVQAAIDGGAGCVIIDSISDEHEGIGGILDMHEAELDRMAGQDWAKRERCTQAAWIKPKRERLDLITFLKLAPVPLILNFRMRQKTKQIKNSAGKMEPTNLGFMPIAPDEFVYSLTLQCLLPPYSQGVPTWQSDKIGENLFLKLPGVFKPLFREGAPITEKTGRALAVWRNEGDAPAGDKTSDRGAPSLTERAARAQSALLSTGDLSAFDKQFAKTEQLRADLKAYDAGLSDAFEKKVADLRADLEAKTKGNTNEDHSASS